MPYEKDFFGYPYDMMRKPVDVMPHDLCCDGCAEHCQLSAKFIVYDAFVKPSLKKETFIDVVMYAGDVRLVFAEPVSDSITMAHKIALTWCRKTCKHSKMK